MHTPIVHKLGGAERPASSIYRAVTAAVRESVFPDGASRYLAQRPADRTSPVIFRAATEPATTAGDNWAGDLVDAALMDFLADLGPLSAGSQLFAMGMQIPFDDKHNVARVPAIRPAALSGAFISEGLPIPVMQFSVSAEAPTPRKMAIIAAVSRELARSSQAEIGIEQVLRESAALTLDHFLFSDTADTGSNPAGLFHGVTPISGTDAFSADPMIADLTALTSAVAPVAGANIAFIASPARALQISSSLANLVYPVLPSSAMSDNKIAAVAVNGVAVSAYPIPDIEVGPDATLHMDDVPAEIVSAGSPGTTAAPVSSMFQTGLIAIRLIAHVSWVKRHSGVVAVREGLAW